MGWNIDDNISKDELKKDRQKDITRRQKAMAKMIGENLASFACVAILIILVSFIWTDIGIFVNLTSFLTDAALTIVLYVLADLCMTRSGTAGGKLSDEYVNLHREYLTLRETVRQAGLSMMESFCAYQIELEYEIRMRKLCKRYKVDYDEFTRVYANLRTGDLKGMLSKGEFAKVVALRQIDRIELSTDILMTDGKVQDECGGVPISGEEYAEKHSTGMGHIFMTAAFAIVAAVPVFTLTQDVSMGRVIYTIFKVSMMLYRMYCGYMRGVKAFGTIERIHLQAKIKYLYLYLEYLAKEKANDTNTSDSGGRRVEDELGVGRAEDTLGA
jgi:hypothetical protein